MPLQRPVSVLAIAALLVLAGCTGVATNASPADSSGSAPDNMTVKVIENESDDGTRIVVSGSHSIEAAPDTAQLHLNIVASGADSAAVRDALAENASALRQALVADGPLDAEQLRSERFRIRENRRARHEPGLDAYRGYHRFVVTLDSVETVETVIDTAVDAANVEVNHVEFGLSDERRAELRDEVLRAAMQNARSEAELLASTEGMTVGTAESMVTDRVHVRTSRAPVVMEGGHAAATPTAGARTEIDVGDVTVSASVSVTYSASEADS